MTEHFDAIVIGTGQAGPALADRMDTEGLKVAVIEKGKLGGTCVNVGCIPTKALVASARVAHVARRSSEFGVMTGDVSIDMKAIKARKDRISGASNEGVTRWMAGLDNGELIRGHARFVEQRTVAVNDRILEADRVFINTGARAFVPPIPGIEEINVLTNVEMMEIDTLPEHLVIVGGSYIGLEFAQMYRRFGSRVTVLERSGRLIPREDEDVSEAIRQVLVNEGVDFRLNTELTGVAKTVGGFRAVLSESGTSDSLIGTHLLMAVGRRPNTEDLGLDLAGIAVDERGYIEVDDALKTNVDGVWALGDVNGKGAFTHTSYNDHEIVVANLFDGDERRVSDRIPVYGLFVDPPLGRVGMTEQQVRDRGLPALVGKRMMSDVGRARERSETDGFMKVIVDAESKQILGAAVLGIGGDEVVHVFLEAMSAKAPYTVIQNGVHIHPTVSELVPTMLGELTPLV